MTDQNDQKQNEMISVPLDGLIRLYAIIDAFREMVEGQIQDAMGAAYLTDKYETLSAACGILGGMIDMDGFRRLAISEEGTRADLAKCYAAADRIVNNTDENSDARSIALNLRACFMAGLNETYETAGSAQDAVGRILYMSQFGEDILSSCREAGPEAFRGAYRSPDDSEATLHGCLEQFHGMFRSLQPRHGTDGIETEE